ncbi:MAG TPA: beta-N-acetylglucosaminidase domain-containing protein [Acidimicrobiales bacterium]|nr:beta-N-acetylglucosaminidase domain-containing protein [Acidimicrobiales bacterium]
MRSHVVVPLLVLVAALGCSGDDDSSGSSATSPGSENPGESTTSSPRPADAPLPQVVPTPREIRWLGDSDVAVPDTAAFVAGDGVDGPTGDLVVEALRSAGAGTVEREGEGDDADLVVRAGLVGDELIADALARAEIAVPPDLPAEGYVLAVDAADDAIVLGGQDAAGIYYGAQTLRQLVGDGRVAGVGVVDSPTLPRRGVVEGFYGSPWTQDERLDQLDFYGRMKLNTYMYAPKADPFHRDRWRDPYPAAELDALGTLVAAAAEHHVHFTFAVSPGVSICYSDAADVDALETKLGALYDLGVRDFAVALDDIAYDRWNCDTDRARYGPNTGETAARAQVELLNGLQQGFVAAHEGTRPLTLVPTEYRNTDDSPYRQVIRAQLDPAVQVMWTGDIVVPAEITAAQAAAAREVFGRPVYVWDNYPVNDFPRTAGRLMLGPYTRREPALGSEISGLISNPMNQAAASKVALVGVADFAWNSPAYDPARAHRAAAELVAAGGGGDHGQTVEALLAFFDLETLSPTSARSEATVSQPQAPVLAERIATFDSTWASGDRAGAITGLRPYAELLAAAPERIRAGVADQGFLADCRPWLDALSRWGEAFVTRLDGLQSQVDGDEATAQSRFAAADDLVAQAQAVHTIAGETLPEGPVLVGDGVLDAFITRS